MDRENEEKESGLKSENESASGNEPDSKPKNERTPRLYPRVGWWGTWVVWLLVAGVIRFAPDDLFDQIPFIDDAVRNLVTFLTLVGLPLSILTWFCFFSDRSSWPVRQGIFWGYLGLVVVVVYTLANFVELDGDLRPIAWKNEVDEAVIVSEGQVDLVTETADDFPYFMGPRKDGKLVGLRLKGNWEKPPKLVWGEKITIGPGHSGFSTRNGFAVTMEQRGQVEITSCYEIVSGKLLWAYEHEARHDTIFGKLGPRSTPTIFDGKVYSLGANGHLACLDGSSGKPVWTKELLEEFGTTVSQEFNAVQWGRSGSPLVFDNRVVVPAGGPPSGPHVSLVCYDRNTGDEIWRSGDSQISYSTPVLFDLKTDAGGTEPVIVSLNEANATGHDPKDGQLLWTVERPGNSTRAANTSQPIFISATSLMFTKGYGLGAERFDFVNGTPETKWKNTAVLKTKFTSAVEFDGYAMALSDGRLECIDVETGKRVWKSRKNYGNGQILLIGKRLLVLSEKGKLVLVDFWDPEEGLLKRPVETASFQALEGFTWNTMALHGNYLLVRNSREAACYELEIEKETE